MKQTNPMLERLQEVYRIDKTFLRILESQSRHSDDLMFVNSCIQNLIEETKNQAVNAKQYIDHLRNSVSMKTKLGTGEGDMNVV